MARQRPHNEKTRLLLLAAGAAVGLVLAAQELVGLARTQTVQLPDDIIARVGNRDIPLDRFRLVLGDFDADRRGPLTAEDLEFALQRLVDEELLVLQGIEMGLAESLPEVRKAVVSAVIAQTVAEAEAVEPSEEQLRGVYEADPGFFTSAAQYRVRWLRRPGAAEQGNAPTTLEAMRLLGAGAAPETVADAAGFEWVMELPDVLMPLTKLRDYLGPDLTHALQEAAPASATGPLVADGMTHILYVAERVPPQLPAFEDIRPLVEAEFTRREGDAALRRHLQRLRRETDISVDSDKLAWP
jgi:hypothetical protein